MTDLLRCPSPVGEILLAGQDDGLTGLWIAGQRYAFGAEPLRERETPVLAQAKAWLDAYFAGEKPDIRALRLTPAGGVFRQTVWALLCEIPYGETVTYGALARETAAHLRKEKMSAQAIGGAVGHNPISIIIPCHRVVGASGNLTGYGGGIATKVKLLTHEGADMTGFFIPKGRTAP